MPFNMLAMSLMAPQTAQKALTKIGPSVNVGLIAIGLFELIYEISPSARMATMGAGNLHQRLFHIFGHARSVAADIEMCAGVKPSPKLFSLFAHSVLDIDLLGAIARPGRRQACEDARGEKMLEFFPVKKVCGFALM